MGILYFGDKLDFLRKHIEDESIVLIYLDPLIRQRLYS